jgi:hypothetical protein
LKQKVFYLFVIFISVVNGGMVKILDRLRRRHRIGRVDATGRIDAFRRMVEVMVVVFDPLAVLSDLDHCSKLLLNRSRSDGRIFLVFVVVVKVSYLQIVNAAAAQRSVAIRSVAISGAVAVAVAVAGVVETRVRV